jgi:hypothetical protein
MSNLATTCHQARQELLWAEAKDCVDAAEILVTTLFGFRSTTASTWSVRETPSGALEAAIGGINRGGNLKTDASVRYTGVEYREVPEPLSSDHPRMAWFRGIKRALRMGGLTNVSTTRLNASRMTKNIRRLLPAAEIQLPGNRFLSVKSCRKTMASAANAAGVPLSVINQFGLWGEKSTTACKNYIDRRYPVQPYTALVWDFLLPVAAHGSMAVAEARVVAL